MSLNRSAITHFVNQGLLPVHVFQRVTEDHVAQLNRDTGGNYTLEEVAAAVQNRAQPLIEDQPATSMDDVEAGPEEENLPGDLANYPWRENFILVNPMSAFWSKRAVKENKENLFILGVLYIPGMIGYALSLPVRVAILGWRILQVVGTFFATLFRGEFSLLGTEMKYRLLILAGSASSVGAGVVGTVCPPLGYSLDEKIHENGFFHQHAYFNLQANDFGSALESLLTGATDLVTKKGKHLHPYGKYFRKAVHTLKLNFKGGEIAAAMPVTLEQISMLGLIYAARDSLQGDPENPLGFLVDYLQEFEIQTIDLETLATCWAFVAENVDEALQYIVTKTLLLEEVDDDSYLEGKKGELEGSLVVNADFESVYQAAKTVVGELNRVDRAFYKVVTALSAVQYI